MPNAWTQWPCNFNFWCLSYRCFTWLNDMDKIIYCSISFIVNVWKQYKCILIGKRLNKWWHWWNNRQPYKRKKRMVTFSVLLHEDTCSVVQETFLYKGLGEGWDKARFGICLNVQKGSITRGQRMEERNSPSGLLWYVIFIVNFWSYISVQNAFQTHGIGMRTVFLCHFTLLCSWVWVDSAVQKMKGRQAYVCVPVWNISSQSHG